MPVSKPEVENWFCGDNGEDISQGDITDNDGGDINGPGGVDTWSGLTYWGLFHLCEACWFMSKACQHRQSDLPAFPESFLALDDDLFSESQEFPVQFTDMSLL